MALVEFQVLIELAAFSELQVETGRKVGKAFREPLVMIGRPTDDMSPPLVRHLVRGDFLDEFSEFRSKPEHLEALSRVEERNNRQIDQRGPRLPKVQLRLL